MRTKKTNANLNVCVLHSCDLEYVKRNCSKTNNSKFDFILTVVRKFVHLHCKICVPKLFGVNEINAV